MEGKNTTYEQLMLQLETIGEIKLVDPPLKKTHEVPLKSNIQRKDFLTSPAFKKERKHLKRKLKLITELLKASQSKKNLVDIIEQKIGEREHLLNKNLTKLVDKTERIEKNYRTLKLFYENASAGKKVKNLSILNIDQEYLDNPDEDQILSIVDKELSSMFDRIDISTAYSLLVIPGYISSPYSLNRWARVAEKNKVLLLTDFRDYDNVKDLIEYFQDLKISGVDISLSKVVMTCNWLISRKDILDRKKELSIPPSAALAGKLYSSNIGQVAAGRKHGSLKQYYDLKMPLNHDEIVKIEKLGLIPFTKWNNQIMSFSATTLNNSNEIAFNLYSSVRVMDWITKILIDFFNRKNFSPNTLQKLNEDRRELVNFFDRLKQTRVIQDFKINMLQFSPTHPDKISFSLSIIPIYAVNPITLKLESNQDIEEDSGWNSTIELS